MQHFNTLTASLTLTAGLMICATAHAQSGPQTVPVRPAGDSGTQLGDAASRLDRDIQVVRDGIVRGDQRPDDLETLLGSADAWLRAAGTDLGAEGTDLVSRQLGRAGTNLLGRSADSVLTLEDLGDFRAAVLDARVERALRRLARSASAGSWSPSEYADVIEVWGERVDFERQRRRLAIGVQQPEIVIDHGGPKFRASQLHQRHAAGTSESDKPDKVDGYGGPGQTMEKKRDLKSAGMDQPDVIIDYRGAGTSLAPQDDPDDPDATGVIELVIDQGGPKFRASQLHQRHPAGTSESDKPDKVDGYGGPGQTMEKKRNLKSAGMDQPDVIIDYRGAGTSLAPRDDPYATGVGRAEIVIQLQEGLDYALQQTRGKRSAGLEEIFLLVTEFRMKVALQRFRQQVGAGQDTTIHQLHMFDLALQRQKQAAGRPK